MIHYLDELRPIAFRGDSEVTRAVIIVGAMREIIADLRKVAREWCIGDGRLLVLLQLDEFEPDDRKQVARLRRAHLFASRSGLLVLPVPLSPRGERLLRHVAWPLGHLAVTDAPPKEPE